MISYFIILKIHSSFINDFDEFFKIFQDYLCFIKDLEDLIYVFYSLRIHILSMMVSSRSFRIFLDFSCLIQDLELYLPHFINNIFKFY